MGKTWREADAEVAEAIDFCEYYSRKAGGPDYLLQFVVPRTVTENTLRRGCAPEASAHGRHS